jgi:4'-phosphopantetheinyl transferase
MNLLWPPAAAQTELSVEAAHVWAVPLDSSPIAEPWCLLSPDECQRAERFRFDEPRRRFVISRAALRMLLGEHLGVPPEDVALDCDANGKPRLLDQMNRDALRFNLAHSGNLAVVAIARDCEVGIDIEQLRAVSHWEQISRRYFHEAEVVEIFGAACELRGAAFLRCWTAKEAVLKAIGMGLSCPLSSFRVPVHQQQGEWVNLPASGSGAPIHCWLEQLSPCDDYVGAVACMGARRRVECRTLRRVPDTR